MMHFLQLMPLVVALSLSKPTDTEATASIFITFYPFLFTFPLDIIWTTRSFSNELHTILVWKLEIAKQNGSPENKPRIHGSLPFMVASV